MRSIVRCNGGLDSSLVENPVIGFAFEGVVAKVEQEMTAWRESVSDSMPVVRAPVQLEIAGDLVELTPRRCFAAEAALPSIPPFVVRRPKSILSSTREPQAKALILGEARKLERVGEKGQHDVAIIDLHDWVWSVRLRILPLAQLSELSRHASLSNDRGVNLRREAPSGSTPC